MNGFCKALAVLMLLVVSGAPAEACGPAAVSLGLGSYGAANLVAAPAVVADPYAAAVFAVRPSLVVGGRRLLVVNPLARARALRRARIARRAAVALRL